ncbi:dGTP triphosphohydrolase [Fodinicurvata sp. EGI_FJ10296]|uniref:dGTP triphosphohydrolase n=1 Tax=Fodinicurvata sp. EGI_FJ10296 TaxID=3231908 RepID=UPI00345544E4
MSGLEWTQLMSKHRVGGEAVQPSDHRYRTAFEIDQDRITWSAAFRSLQDKRQVHGSIVGSDYVRSRLTHTAEIVRVARTIGFLVGERICRRHPELEVDPPTFGHLLAAAAAGHDIGHGPFGHLSEDIASEWWQSSPLGRELRQGLSARMSHELTHWEGNAQGFRILTRIEGWRQTGGLQLTAAALCTYTKYPWTAPEIPGEARPSLRKFGCFEGELPLFREAFEACGLPELAPGHWMRHPLATALECADDCYLVTDLEDGYAVGALSYREVEDLLQPLAGTPRSDYADLESDEKRIVFLRAKAVKTLVNQSVDAFFDNYDTIMDGRFDDSLLTCIPAADVLGGIRQISKPKLYDFQSRVVADLKAERVVRTVLENFAAALYDREVMVDTSAVSIRNQAVLNTIANVERIPLRREAWIRAMMDRIIALTDRAATEQAAILS